MSAAKITKIARFTVNLIVCFVVAFASFSVCAAGVDTALAASHEEKVNKFSTETGQEDYASKMTSNQGWGSEVFGSIMDDKGEGTPTATTFVGHFNNISNAIGTLLIPLTFVLIVARMAIRGVYEMAFRQGNDDMKNDNESHSILLALIATGDERSKGKITFKKDWVVPMLIENGKLLVLIIFIWVVMSIVASIVMFGISTLVQQTDDAGLGLSTFNAGGVSVSTS